MSTTLTRPRTVVAILAVAALVAFGVLLILGTFEDNGPKTAPPSVVDANNKAYQGYQGIPVPGATPVVSGGGIQQAEDQMNERRLEHGAPILVFTTGQVQGLTYEGAAKAVQGVVGDTKDDLPATQLGHGALGYGPGPYPEYRNGTPAQGQELALGDRAAGAGH